MDNLPYEIVFNILLKLNIKDIMEVISINHKYYLIRNDNYFWYRKVKTEYPTLKIKKNLSCNYYLNLLKLLLNNFKPITADINYYLLLKNFNPLIELIDINVIPFEVIKARSGNYLIPDKLIYYNKKEEFSLLEKARGSYLINEWNIKKIRTENISNLLLNLSINGYYVITKKIVDQIGDLINSDIISIKLIIN